MCYLWTIFANIPAMPIGTSLHMSTLLPQQSIMQLTAVTQSMSHCTRDRTKQDIWLIVEAGDERRETLGCAFAQLILYRPRTDELQQRSFHNRRSAILPGCEMQGEHYEHIPSLSKSQCSSPSCIPFSSSHLLSAGQKLIIRVC